MALKTLVKINSVNNLSDARYCAGMMVDQIGFSMNPDRKEYVSPELFKEITGWIAGVKIVGEFEDMNADEIIKALPSYGLDLVQVNSLKVASELCGYNQPIIFSVDVSKTDPRGLQGLLEEAAEYAKFILIDNSEEAVSEDVLQIVSNCSDQLPIILGTGISPKNVNEIVDRHHFKGIALKGSDEIKPGLKDYDQIADILEEIETEE
ncbi:MAG: N-(5'-phosphoribosyl)anthranilate isomerase [Cytophagales bacterium]|nr:N-(5'-phosphoribosyl)anthranilate isomerase [Cytophagales bacterium]